MITNLFNNHSLINQRYYRRKEINKNKIEPLLASLVRHRRPSTFSCPSAASQSWRARLESLLDCQHIDPSCEILSTPINNIQVRERERKRF